MADTHNANLATQSDLAELERILGIRNGSTNEKGNNRIGDGHNVHDKTQSDLAELEWIAGIRNGGDRKSDEHNVPLKIRFA